MRLVDSERCVTVKLFLAASSYVDKDGCKHKLN